MWLALFIITFMIMEFVAWWLHKYVMHGFLWGLHKDHHNPNPGRVFQKNDSFALFFAVPSFFLILFGTQGYNPLLAAIGFGIMAYGFIYFVVHEVIIHKRLRSIKLPMNSYFKALRIAHGHHHCIKTKEHCKNFGMLVVPLSYFRKQVSKEFA